MSQEQRAEKSAVIDDVRERFDEAEAVLVTEYRGLDVSQMADLRRALRETETVYKIYKNTCLLYTSPSPRDLSTSRMPSSA